MARACVFTAGLASSALAGEVLYGPSSPAVQPQWLANLTLLRSQSLASVNYSGEIYTDFLPWTPTMFVAPQSMVHDSYLFDVTTGLYTVDRFLDDLVTRYGGIDGVLLWPTYPNIGIDDRTQFDMLLDMPGGIPALQKMVARFHARGVKVGFPYNPWDSCTRGNVVSDQDMIANIWAQLDVDFFNGDTMSYIDESFWNASTALGHPIGIQPEGGPQLNTLMWTKMGWGYWDWSPYIPPVDQWKWFETRHTTCPCDRWNGDHTTNIQFGYFNGEGWVSWESVWNIWRGIPPRNCELTRRSASILRFFAGFLTSPAWVPHDILNGSAANAGVFASRWPAAAGAVYSNNATVWTIVNRGSNDYTGAVLPVPCNAPGTSFYDLYHGVVVTPSSDGSGGCVLAFTVEAGGIGGVLAIATSDVNSDLQTFLSSMATMTSTPLASYSIDMIYLVQNMVPILPTTPATSTPAGMVHIPGVNNWQFVVEGIEIEGSNLPGVDFQYPGEGLQFAQRYHNFSVNMTPFYIDTTPVTNAVYATYLQDSGYFPTDPHNFLLWWNCTSPTSCNVPSGAENKPVTYVALEEARAFCTFYGKRLPNEWEWQYAAQGVDGRMYPWGNTKDDSRVPPFQQGGSLQPPVDVGTYVNGSSPFGMLDAVGLVWQWTSEFYTTHTRDAPVRGGSYYRPPCSEWYFPRTLQLNQHGNWLLMAPSMDRRGTLGFRCVVDAAQ